MRKNITWSIFAFIVSFTTSLFAQSTIKHPVLNTPQIIEFSNPINSKEHAKVLNKVGNYSTSVTWKKLNQIESDGELHTRYQILYKRIPSQLGIGIVHEFHDHESSKKSGIFRINGDFIPEHLFQGQLRIASEEARAREESKEATRRAIVTALITQGKSVEEIIEFEKAYFKV
jgi:hypothetical protein